MHSRLAPRRLPSNKRGRARQDMLTDLMLSRRRRTERLVPETHLGDMTVVDRSNDTGTRASDMCLASTHQKRSHREPSSHAGCSPVQSASSQTTKSSVHRSVKARAQDRKRRVCSTSVERLPSIVAIARHQTSPDDISAPTVLALRTASSDDRPHLSRSAASREAECGKRVVSRRLLWMVGGRSRARATLTSGKRIH